MYVYLMVPEGANSSSATAAVSRGGNKRGWNKAPSCATANRILSMLSYKISNFWFSKNKITATSDERRIQVWKTVIGYLQHLNYVLDLFRAK